MVPGSGFGGPGHFRIAFCVGDETITGAMPGTEYYFANVSAEAVERGLAAVDEADRHLIVTGTFDDDILPLFTEADVWFEGSEACTDCHYDNSEDSRHEMDLSSYAGIMLGGDVRLQGVGDVTRGQLWLVLVLGGRVLGALPDGARIVAAGPHRVADGQRIAPEG